MKKIIILILVFLPAIFFAQEISNNTNNNIVNKWNIIIAQPANKTDNKADSELQIVIQKSVANALSDVNYYQITSTNDTVENIDKTTLDKYYNANLDILVYSYYYVHNEKIDISVKAVDLITRNVKFQKTYHGEAGIDVFDTIDMIVQNLKGDLSKVVPPMADDVVIKYRKRTVLVTEGIKLKREFISRVGLIGDHNNGGFPFDPILGFEANFKKFSFGVSFFFPVLLSAGRQDDGTWLNVSTEMHFGYNLSSKWRLMMGFYFAHTTPKDVKPLLPLLGARFSPSHKLNISLIAAMTVLESGYYLLVPEVQYFFSDNWGAGFSTHFELGGGFGYKLDLSVLYRVSFD